MGHTALRVALLLVVVASLSVGTAGFSAVEADRTISVAVVDDDEAYVGVVACTNGKSNSNVVHLRLQNRFSKPLTVASVTSPDADRYGGSSVSGKSTVGPGERTKLTPKFDGPVDTVTVSVTGDAFDATVTVGVSDSNGNVCPGTNDNSDDDAPGQGSGHSEDDEDDD